MPPSQKSGRFPNVEWGWRMPLRRLSWRLAWWLMRRVTMRGYTTHQQARMIHDALGAYRPRPPRVKTSSSAQGVTVHFGEEYDGGSGPFGF